MRSGQGMHHGSNHERQVFTDINSPGYLPHQHISINQRPTVYFSSSVIPFHWSVLNGLAGYPSLP